jgi:hypothetical protein
VLSAQRPGKGALCFPFLLHFGYTRMFPNEAIFGVTPHVGRTAR